MLVDYLSQYGLFLAKVLTFVIAFLFVVASIIALLHKNKKQEGSLHITHINKERSRVKEHLQSETCDKSIFKLWRKEQKIVEKSRKTEDSRKTSSKKLKKTEKSDVSSEPRLFVIRFSGDVRATQVNALRHTITAIIDIAAPDDAVLLILESMGGLVHGYGLAASQLDRLRQQKIHLTVAIDKVAASGGYMMAAVGNKIIAAPFAIVGSIGVIAQLPNFHRFLEKHDIDFEQQTAGEYKRTLTVFGKNTEKGRHKFQEEIEETHILFKKFIQQYRPQLDINQVATGEHWYAIDALGYQLIDSIATSDSVITEKLDDFQVYELTFEEPQSFKKKIFSGVSMVIDRSIDKLLQLSMKPL